MKALTVYAIYDDLKLLFDVDEESYKLFLDLKKCTALGGGMILYLSPDKCMLHNHFIRYCEYYKIPKSKIDINNHLIREKDYIIKFMTIEDIKTNLHGHRFKEVRFTF